MAADTGQADGSAPAPQPAGPSGPAFALAQLESWHHDVVELIDGWAWIRSLNDQLTALLAPWRERYQDNPVLELMHGGRWLGHPMHPALSDLPIGLWGGSMLLDLIDRDPAPEGGLDPAGLFTAAGEVQEHGAGPEADGQVAEGRVQRVTEPPAAVHQLEDRVVLVLLAPRRQHGGQLVVQRAYPAPAVDQRDQIVMPVLHPGQHGGRPGEPGGLGGWCRAFGLAGVCCHEVLRADGRNRCAERTLSSPMSPFHAETPLEAAGPAGAGVKG